MSFRFEAKIKIFGSETKRKNAVLISLWFEANNLKRKETKKKKISRNFFWRNQRTLLGSSASKGGPHANSRDAPLDQEQHAGSVRGGRGLDP
jgi:hypothetical protein